MSIADNFLFRDAILSDDEQFRYLLTRQTANFRKKKSVLVVIGLNPSTADAVEDDNTLRRCMGYALSWGLERLWMVNLFALRTKDPEIMKKASDPVGDQTDHYLREAFDQVLVHGGMILVAWGTDGEYKKRDEEVLGLIPPTLKPYCLGITNGGFPRHPLYAEKDITPQVYKKKKPPKRRGKHRLSGRRRRL